MAFLVFLFAALAAAQSAGGGQLQGARLEMAINPNEQQKAHTRMIMTRDCERCRTELKKPDFCGRIDAECKALRATLLIEAARDREKAAKDLEAATAVGMDSFVARPRSAGPPPVPGP